MLSKGLPRPATHTDNPVSHSSQVLALPAVTALSGPVSRCQVHNAAVFIVAATWSPGPPVTSVVAEAAKGRVYAAAGQKWRRRGRWTCRGVSGGSWRVLLFVLRPGDDQAEDAGRPEHASSDAKMTCSTQWRKMATLISLT